MEFSIILGLFVLGTILGSFYNVVASRLPNGESIVHPGSHCPNCGHSLKFWELIPIISFIIQKGKCTNCKIKMSIFYPISEALCGILFVICYLVFGITPNLIIALTFVSMIIIVTLSDHYYMIINDSVLIVSSILLIIEIYFINGIDALLSSLLSALISFIIMLLLKLFGDFVFKKESMGGGDIKLMAVFGLVIGWKLSIISIFIASFIAFPISIISLKKNKEHVLPFGPYLCMGALILYFSQIDMNMIIDFLNFL